LKGGLLAITSWEGKNRGGPRGTRINEGKLNLGGREEGRIKEEPNTQRTIARSLYCGCGSPENHGQGNWDERETGKKEGAALKGMSVKCQGTTDRIRGKERCMVGGGFQGGVSNYTEKKIKGHKERSQDSCQDVKEKTHTSLFTKVGDGTKKMGGGKSEVLWWSHRTRGVDWAFSGTAKNCHQHSTEGFGPGFGGAH